MQYDVFLVIGQSNTHFGFGYDPAIDIPGEKVKQLGRFAPDRLKIIPANEPLQHHTAAAGYIGFALTFANLYADQKLESGREVLILPCGFGGTGFVDHRWNPGDDLFEDAKFRLNAVLEQFPGSKLKAFLWHQGETDIGNTGYSAALDHMIETFRNDMYGAVATDTVPFIAGGMVPYWVNQDSIRQVQENILKDTQNRLPKIGFADPNMPFVIVKPDDTFDEIHFDAAGQREMGKRYFQEYLRLTQ